MAVADGGWAKLANLPDPVGFGGMFAGVLNNRLVVGGGSQFAGEPLWRGGEKIYGDKIYVLSDPQGNWSESELRLPKRLGHFAVASHGNGIFLAGGLSVDGAERLCLRVTVSGQGLIVERLASLPKALAFAVAAVVGDRLIVAGGQSEVGVKVASREVWSLDITQPSADWRREVDLPGPGVIVAAAAVFSGHFYVFGGLAYDETGRPIPSARAYRYNITSQGWEVLADLSKARVGAASPCPVLEDGRILVAGGYDTVFPGAPREHPGFSRQTLLYDPRLDLWDSGPIYPMEPVENLDSVSDGMPRPPAAAAGANWRGQAIIVGGETRPSVRTPVVLAWSRP